MNIKNDSGAAVAEDLDIPDEGSSLAKRTRTPRVSDPDDDAPETALFINPTRRTVKIGATLGDLPGFRAAVNAVRTKKENLK
ncbi:MAG TPA: hypothetical protein VN397_04655 [Candidatus Methylomirabilis sp.]|nr:hypothetical protein [Candidatus Methylomirabilis sp.]